MESSLLPGPATATGDEHPTPATPTDASGGSSSLSATPGQKGHGHGHGHGIPQPPPPSPYSPSAASGGSSFPSTSSHSSSHSHSSNLSPIDMASLHSLSPGGSGTTPGPPPPSPLNFTPGCGGAADRKAVGEVGVTAAVVVAASSGHTRGHGGGGGTSGSSSSGVSGASSVISVAAAAAAAAGATGAGGSTTTGNGNKILKIGDSSSYAEKSPIRRFFIPPTLEKKHSSGDLHSRLKTRKMLGVGETDNGDIHRSKISQVLGHNEHLYLKLPRGFWNWQMFLSGLYAVQATLLILAPATATSLGLVGLSPVIDQSEEAEGTTTPLSPAPTGCGNQYYGAALLSFSFLLWKFLYVNDKHVIRATQFASLVHYALLLTVDVLAILRNGFGNLFDTMVLLMLGLRLAVCVICYMYLRWLGLPSSGLRRSPSYKDGGGGGGGGGNNYSPPPTGVTVSGGGGVGGGAGSLATGSSSVGSEGARLLGATGGGGFDKDK